MPYTDAGTDINKVRLQPELIENIAASYIKQVLHAVESLHRYVVSKIPDDVSYGT